MRTCVKLFIEKMVFYNFSLASYKSRTLIVDRQNNEFRVLGNEENSPVERCPKGCFPWV